MKRLGGLVEIRVAAARPPTRRVRAEHEGEAREQFHAARDGVPICRDEQDDAAGHKQPANGGDDGDEAARPVL